MAVQSTLITCIFFINFLNFPDFKDFFIDFFEKNDLHVVSDLNFFSAWFENEYRIYQLRSKGYILSIYTSPLAIKLSVQKSCCKYFFPYCIIKFRKYLPKNFQPSSNDLGQNWKQYFGLNFIFIQRISIIRNLNLV